jgi:hypothetical protein
MRLLDRYERELVDAARRLEQQPYGRARARRAAGGAIRALAWVPAVLVLALAAGISAIVMSAGRDTGEAGGHRLAGWYVSSAPSGRPLPKGAPHGSTLRLGGDGRYRLTTGIYRVSGRYRLRGDALEFLSAGRYEALPTFGTGMVRLPDAPRCRAALGVYRLIERGDSLTLELSRDGCRPRARVLSYADWHRGGR